MNDFRVKILELYGNIHKYLQLPDNIHNNGQNIRWFDDHVDYMEGKKLHSQSTTDYTIQSCMQWNI